MKKGWVVFIVISIALAIVTTSDFLSRERQAGQRTELLISAAASLKDSLEEIGKLYEDEHPQIDLVFNYGSSGTLQKQIEHGAPADLFISAGKKQMDALIKENLIAMSATLLTNELVVVVPSGFGGTIATASDLAGKEIRKLAVGEPESVPAGQYAKESLTAVNLWPTVKDKIVFAKNVRQVLAYVETGNVEAGIVYKTDAIVSDKVKIALNISPEWHKPIVYPAGVLKSAERDEEAEAFYRFLQSKQAADVFVKYGFKLSKIKE